MVIEMLNLSLRWRGVDSEAKSPPPQVPRADDERVNED